MAKSGTIKKINLKAIITLIVTAAVIVGGVLFVRSFAAEKKKGEELRQQKEEADDVAKAAEAVSKQFGKPIKTIADTDTARRYGYDVLYANHGLRIMLTESKIYIDKPEITLDLINESDRKMNVLISYACVNGLEQWPELDCDIEAGKTVTSKLVFTGAQMSKIQVKRLRLCFNISDDDELDELSEPIVIDYEGARNEEWTPPSSCVSVYGSDDLSFSAYPFEIEEQEKRFYLRSAIYMSSKRDDDTEISLKSYKLYDKSGNEIDPDHHIVYFSSIIPGHTLTNRYLKLLIKKNTIDPDILGEITVTAEVYPRGSSEDDGKEEITFTVSIGEPIPMEED